MSEHRPQIDEVFDEALRRAAGSDRARYLDETCGGDLELRRRVERLLQAVAEAGSFLEAPAQDPSPSVDQPSVESPGTVIGPYKLIEPIGEGGMGTVWMAQQTEPVKRLVAVKLIKAGMDSRQVIARFEAERQALALMDHPNIARVLDAGTIGGTRGEGRGASKESGGGIEDLVQSSESPDSLAPRPSALSNTSGRPYFVMDLVKGVPITKYCDEHRLTARQRLELFVQVCQAVQHAHQKGIIHRDLKPSNVLVEPYDGRPVPKVIDFGVAKATGPSLTDKTLVTGFGNIVGTLEYMSPEQAELNNHDIDTRSDIYALGVLLYELLTGSPPFNRRELEKAGMLEMLRVIREQEPSKPSTTLSAAEALPTLAANRGTEPAKLTKLVRGDLDWIVMKALEKDRNRRYETANGFAMDVRRYLADEAVQACPPSVGYRMRKFARRNRVTLVMASVIGTSILLVVGSIGWVVRDRSAREQELTQAQAARQTKLNQQVELALNEANALRVRALELTENPYHWEATLAAARSAFKRSEGLAAQDDTALELPVCELLGKLRVLLDADENDRLFVARFNEIRLEQTRLDLSLSRFEEETAFASIRNAFRAAYRIEFGTTSVGDVAKLIQQRPKVIQEFLLAALDVALAHAPGPAPSIRAWLTEVSETADPDPWRKEARRALIARDEPALAKLSRDTLAARRPVSVLLWLASGFPWASESRLKFLRDIQRAYPDDFWANHYLAAALQYNDAPRWDDAIRFHSAAIAVRPRDPSSYVNLGNAFVGKGDLAEAIAAYRRATELAPNYPEAYLRLGSTLRAKGDREGADAAYRRCVESSPSRANGHFRVGLERVMNARDKDGAVDAYQSEQAIVDLTRAIELEPGYAGPWNVRGCAYQQLNQWDEAIRNHTRAIELNPEYVVAWNDRGWAYQRSNRLNEAIVDHTRAIELSPKFTLAWTNRSAAYLAQGDWEKVLTDASKAIELDPTFAPAWLNRGDAHSKLGHWEEAITDYRTVTRLATKGVNLQASERLAMSLNNLAWRWATDADPMARKPERAVQLAKEAVESKPTAAAYWNTLGVAHYRTGKWNAALEALTKSMKFGQRDDSFDAFFLAMTHWQLGNKDDARKWYDQAVRWMDKNQPENGELRRFRAEATKVLGIKDP